MNRPVLLIVDADAETRRDLGGALDRRFGGDYRIEGAATADAALAMLRAAERDSVAVVIADVWLPDDGGLAFLQRVRELHPGAMRVLMLLMSDMAAMGPLHGGMGLGQIDNFIMKPAWHWPEEYLYPQLQEVLTAWARLHGPRMELMQVVGERWSARSHELRDRLSRNVVPHGYYDADSTAGAALLTEHGLTGARLPVVIFLNGHVLVDPSNAELARAIGVQTRPRDETYDVAVIGAGPAGLAAAVYGASEGLATAVVESQALGGQAGTSSNIRNYLGFPRGVSGSELTSRAVEQALHFRAEFIFASEAVGRSREGDTHVITLADGVALRSRAVVIATGVTYRRLGIPELEGLVGAGVFYGAALSEAQAMAGQQVFVVGAGNSAGQAALHLARTAARVTLLVRGGDLAASMSDYLIREICTQANIEVRLNTRVAGGAGRGRLEGLVLEDARSGAREQVPAAALFVMIGARPHTDWVGTDVQRDSAGYLRTGRDLDLGGWSLARGPLPLETSVPGVFAVGDVRTNAAKRVASAVGEGSVSIRLVHEYLASVGRSG